MATVRVSKSGKQVQFYEDDHGVVYGFSKEQLLNLLLGKVRSGIIRGSRLPFRVSGDRFEPSPVFVDGELISLDEARERGIESALACDLDSSPSLSNDSLSPRNVQRSDDKRTYGGKL